MAKEAEWQKRVAQWRASGLTAQDFAAERDFAPSTLTWWARRLEKETSPRGLRVARVLRRKSRAAAADRRQSQPDRMVVEVGVSRVHVPDGVDTATLEAVLTVLGAPGRTA